MESAERNKRVTVGNCLLCCHTWQWPLLASVRSTTYINIMATRIKNNKESMKLNNK